VSCRQRRRLYALRATALKCPRARWGVDEGVAGSETGAAGLSLFVAQRDGDAGVHAGNAVWTRYARSMREGWTEELNFSEHKVLDLSSRVGEFEPHPLQMCVMPLIAVHVADGSPLAVKPFGTAFVIGPGLLVTAKHVIEAAEPYLDEDVTLHAVYQRAKTSKTDTWGVGLPIRRAHKTSASDLAVLEFLLPRPDALFWRFPLTFREPVVGDAVLAFGYPEMTASKEPVGLNRRLMASQGIIQDVRQEALDPKIFYFPAIQSDFASPSGTSGGPVVGPDGHVLAVVARSSEEDDESGVRRWFSEAALLRFILTFEVATEIDGEVRTCSIRELADAGLVLTDGSHSESGGAPRRTPHSTGVVRVI
jgi:S1-C subfamily serine protease